MFEYATNEDVGRSATIAPMGNYEIVSPCRHRLDFTCGALIDGQTRRERMTIQAKCPEFIIVDIVDCDTRCIIYLNSSNTLHDLDETNMRVSV